jgi:FtsX-like permease family
MLAMIKVNLLRRWGRTALTGLGVAVGVTTVVALLALTGGLSRSAGDLAKLGRADFGVFQSGLSDLTASSLPATVVPRVRRLPGVAAAAPIQIVPSAVAADSSMLVFGAEPQSFLTRRLVLVTAVGWTRSRIARLILGESVAVSLLGTGIGLAVGAIASELLVNALAAATFVSPALTPWVIGRGLLVGLALGVLGALFSLWQVMRVPTLEALQRA